MLNEGDYIIVKIPLNGVLLDERNTGESIVVGEVYNHEGLSTYMWTILCYMKTKTNR